MATVTAQSRAWALAEAQEWVVTHEQLVGLGFTASAIRHRIAEGRLHRRYRGVYAVGRRVLSRRGEFMAAVLRCGPEAVLSHDSAAELKRMRPGRHDPIEVIVPGNRAPRVPGIRVHRCSDIRPEEIELVGTIPLTSAVRTLVDLSNRLPENDLEAAVNEADVQNLIDPAELRSRLDAYSGRPGVRKLRKLLDRDVYRMTETELERRFLRLVRRAGLPLPDTQQQVGGRVDFYWEDLALVVETDGWRYHRTPARQAKDNRRMQEHAAAGRRAIRVSHYEIRFESLRVEELIRRLAG